MKPDTFIGVDVSKGWLDYAITDKRRKSMLKLRTDNNLAGFRKLVKEMRNAGYILGKKVLVTMENTGGYQRQFVDYLVKKKCSICVDNPLRIKRSMGIERGKNDELDAERILDYSVRHKDKLKLWIQPRKVIIILGDLLSNRERLLKYLRACEVALVERSQLHKRGDRLLLKKLNANAIEGMKDSLQLIEEELDSLVHSDSAIKEQYRLLLSVPGIGKIIALNLIYRTNEFQRYQTGKELACFAGVAPFDFKSGVSIVGRPQISAYGNAIMKKYLHIGAVACLSKKNHEFKQFYDRKVSEGKHKMLVINIIRRKILTRAAAVIKRSAVYTHPREAKKNIQGD